MTTWEERMAARREEVESAERADELAEYDRMVGPIPARIDGMHCGHGRKFDPPGVSIAGDFAKCECCQNIYSALGPWYPANRCEGCR